MNTLRPQSGSREERLGEAVFACLQALEAGQPLGEAELRARYPDLADDLLRYLDGRREVERLAAPLRHAVQDGPAPGPGGEASAVPESVLGDFRLLREVGRGGMGVVYEAEQVSLGRRVALKVLPPAVMLDPRGLRRFYNEARAAAGLHHTHIVPVYAVGCERGVHFYAMQFIDGRSLADLLRDLRRPDAGTPDQRTTPFEPAADGAGGATVPEARQTAATGSGAKPGREYYRRVAAWGVQAAEALDHAHQLGVVHRDVKPANLLVDGRGDLWVTDFGLAQVQQGEASLTRTGDLVGTLRYMSPEQALAKRVVIDHRTDVYSLGATLYELLTLRPAFSGSDRQELLRQIAFDEPRPPRRVSRAVPAELEVVVLKCLEKSPADRYATAQELADDLRRWLDDRPIQARRPSVVQRLRKWARRHRPLVTAGAVALVLAVIGLAISNFLVWREKQAKEEALRNAQRREQEVRSQAAVLRELRNRSEASLEGALRAMGQLLSEAEKGGPLPPAVADQAVLFYEAVLPPETRQPSPGRGTKQGMVRPDQSKTVETGRPSLLCETAWAHVRLGNLYALRGRFDRARAAYSASDRFFFSLAANSLDWQEAQRLLSQERPDVEEEFRRALGRWKRAEPEGWGDIPDYRLRWASSEDNPKDRERLERLLADLPNLEHRQRVMSLYLEHANSLWDTTRVQHGGRMLLEIAGGPPVGYAVPYGEPPVQNETVHFPGGPPPAEARALYLRALEYGEQWESDPGAGKEDAEGFVNDLGWLADLFGNSLKASEEARRAYRAIWKLRLMQARERPDASALRLAQAARDYGGFLRGAGAVGEARAVCRQALGRIDSRAADLPAAAKNQSVEALLLLSDTLAELEAPGDAERAARAALALSERLGKENPTAPAYRTLLGVSIDQLAWLLATCPDARRRDPPQAILLARRAVDLSPKKPDFYTTLGVAHYYAGDPRAAAEVLRKAVQLREGLRKSLSLRKMLIGTRGAADFFFLALAIWRLGDGEQARRWYERGTEWMQQTTPQDEELCRFRAEAADLLKIEPQATAPDKAGATRR